jgi:type II secretory pathway component PulC
MKQTRFPPGWDEAKLERVLAHYEAQTDTEAVAEDEAASEEPDQALVGVPRELVPAIRELIAKHRK